MKDRPFTNFLKIWAQTPLHNLAVKVVPLFYTCPIKLATLALMWPYIFSIENHVKTLQFTEHWTKDYWKESIRPKMYKTGTCTIFNNCLLLLNYTFFPQFCCQSWLEIHVQFSKYYLQRSPLNINCNDFIGPSVFGDASHHWLKCMWALLSWG